MLNSTSTPTVSKASGYQGAGRKLSWARQIGTQAVLLFIAFTVLFPILWIVSLSLDPRGIARPKELNIIPPGASLTWYQKVLEKPTSNPVNFADWRSTASSWQAAARWCRWPLASWRPTPSRAFTLRGGSC